MKSIGLARLGRDAEVRATPGGESVCNLSLAVTVYDKNAEHNRGTQWIDATLWGKQAEALAQYLRKGTVHCFTLSDLRIETYQKNGGGEGVKMVARVDNVELGPRQDDGGQQGCAPAAGGYQRAPAAAPAPRQASKLATGFGDMDDDIPF